MFKNSFLYFDIENIYFKTISLCNLRVFFTLFKTYQLLNHNIVMDKKILYFIITLNLNKMK